VKRLTTILGTAFATWAVFAGLAAAATLTITSATLSAGSAPVTSCGVSSLTATRTVDNGGAVTEVDVAGVPQACAGQRLSVTLRDSSGGSLGSAGATIGACSGGCTVAFSSFGSVSASSLAGYAFAVTG
jgi:hypothetical protein